MICTCTHKSSRTFIFYLNLVQILQMLAQTLTQIINRKAGLLAVSIISIANGIKADN